VDAVSKPPRAPYPPDLEDAGEAAAFPGDLGNLTDLVVVNADWANQRASRLELRRVEVRRCRMTGAELGEASLADVVFDDCRLDLVGLRFAKLERVVFRDCQMTECDLYEASLKDVLFERCTLREATFSAITLERVELRGCDLAGAHGVESLRAARMPWNDVLASASVFATALGIEILDRD
jgi:uncharacterized protein YjbI with pentapeptide repeats